VSDLSEQADPFLDYDAAYVMGALDPQDRRAFESHLSTCEHCRAAVAELAGLPGLLAQVPAGQMLTPRKEPELPPQTLLPRLVAQVRRQRRRRRIWGTAAGAVAAACLICAFVLASGAIGSDGPYTAARPPVAGAPGAPGDQGDTLLMIPPGDRVIRAVTVSVQLDPVAWGTRVNLECTYAEGQESSQQQEELENPEEPGSPVYRLVLLARHGGGTQQLAAWTALAGKTVRVTGSTNLKIADIEDIRLQTSRGVTLLHVKPSQT
jgi:hypothetical protein